MKIALTMGSAIWYNILVTSFRKEMWSKSAQFWAIATWKYQKQTKNTNLGSKLIFQLKAVWKSAKKLARIVIWKKQLKSSWKYFLRSWKKLGTHCDSPNLTKCWQKAIKKADFDLARFVNRGNAQKMSNCTLFDIFCRFGENLEICRKALFGVFLAKNSNFNFSHDFWEILKNRNRQSYERFSKIDPQVQLDTHKRLQKFSMKYPHKRQKPKRKWKFFFWKFFLIFFSKKDEKSENSLDFTSQKMV